MDIKDITLGQYFAYRAPRTSKIRKVLAIRKVPNMFYNIVAIKFEDGSVYERLLEGFLCKWEDFDIEVKKLDKIEELKAQSTMLKTKRDKLIERFDSSVKQDKGGFPYADYDEQSEDNEVNICMTLDQLEALLDAQSK